MEAQAGAEELAAIIRGTADAVIGKAPDGTITSWNAGAERLYGYPADEVLGRSIEVIIPPDRRGEEQHILDQIATGGTVMPYQTRRRRKDGSVVDVSLTVSPIRDHSGSVVGASAIARDVTALLSRENQLSAMIEAAPDAFIVVDSSGTVQFVNRQTEQLFGYSRAEMVGAPIEMLVPDRARERHPGLRGAYSEHPTARPMRGRNLSGKRKDGTEFSVDISLTPLDTASGLLIAAAVRDATERKAAEAQFEALLEAAPDAIIVVDGTGTIQIANERTKTMFGYSSAELIGKPVEMLIPDGSRDKHPKLRDGYVHHPTVRPMGAGLQLWALRKDGSRFPADISLSPLKRPSGTLVTAAVRDITDRLRVEDALRDAKEAAELANQAKSEFLSRMSHELRTPLTAILGFTELLQMSEVGTEQREMFVERTHRAGQHLLSLINDVLDISRVESGRLSISVEPVGIQPVVREVLDLVGAMAEAQDIAITDDTNELVVLADRNRLRQVLVNIVSNAVKYNRPGGSVRVSSRAVEGDVLIDVADTGIGISADDLPKLFKPFERLSAETGEVDGTGIGLALSRGLAERMGGSIWVSSEVGEGSVFTLRMPTAENAERAEVVAAGTSNATSTVSVSTVLYIEDNPSNRVLVESALSLRPNIRLLTASHGSLGLDMAREHLPDLILLDLHLPDGSGEDVLRSLKADDATMGIPVIVVSADATKRRISTLRRAGAWDYVTKPLVISEFLATIDATLEDSTA